jgi:hypothetical protein
VIVHNLCNSIWVIMSYNKITENIVGSDHLRPVNFGYNIKIDQSCSYWKHPLEGNRTEHSNIVEKLIIYHFF